MSMATAMQRPAASDDAASRQRVVVTFFTTTFPLQMPEQTYSIPIATLPEGLNKIVQSVLEIDPQAQSFDFLVGDEYLTTTLERFLRRRAISFETLLSIEYTPALQAKEGNKLPHDDWVSSVRAPFAGYSNILLTGAYDHCVRLWDGDDCLAVGACHREAVMEVAIHPGVPIPQRDPAPTSTGARRRKREGALRDFQCVSCSKDGSVVAWRYDSAQGKVVQLGSLRPHSDSVDSVDISPVTGRLLSTASWDHTVKVFAWTQMLSDEEVAPEKKAPLLSFDDHTRPVLTCRFSQANGERELLSAGLDGIVKVWDVEKSELKAEMKGSHAVHGLAVKPLGGGAGDLVLASCTDNRVRLYDARQKSVVKTFTGHRQWVYASAWLWRPEEAGGAAVGTSASVAPSDLFASASEDATLRVWDMRCTSSALLTLDSVHTDGILDVTYAGSMEIASCGKDNKTKTSVVSR